MEKIVVIVNQTEPDPPIGSTWLAYHSEGEDIVLVLGDSTRSHVPCLVLTTGQHIETWIANFPIWVRLL